MHWKKRKFKERRRRETYVRLYDGPVYFADKRQPVFPIIQEMVLAGVYRQWAADFLYAVHYQIGIPPNATVFIPDRYDDAAAAFAALHDPVTVRLEMGRHVIPSRLSFSDLRAYKRQSLLYPLLPGGFFPVTDDSDSNFSLDGVRVSHPDFFVSSSVAIHVISSPLKPYLYRVYEPEISEDSSLESSDSSVYYSSEDYGTESDDDDDSVCIFKFENY